MLSKVVRPFTLPSLIRGVQLQPMRYAGKIFPPTQYDMPIPKRFHLGHVMRNHWEILPVIIATCTALCFSFLSIIWATRNKIDVTFRGHDHRDTISRTMCLCEPTVHKLVTINQLYEPWPEMQEVLANMYEAELALPPPCKD